MNKFSAYRITNASLLKNYIFGAFIRYKASTLQDTVIILFGMAMLLALRRPLLHQLFGVHLRPVHFRPGKSPARTLNADGLLYDFKPPAGIHKPPHQTEVATQQGLARPHPCEVMLPCEV